MSKPLALYDADEIHGLAQKILELGAYEGVDEKKIASFLSCEDADAFLSLHTKNNEDGSFLYPFANSVTVQENAFCCFKNSKFDSVRKALPHLSYSGCETLLKDIIALDPEALKKCLLTPFAIRPFLTHEALVSIFESFLDTDYEKAKEFFLYLSYADWSKLIISLKAGWHTLLKTQDILPYLDETLKKEIAPENKPVDTTKEEDPLAVNPPQNAPQKSNND